MRAEGSPSSSFRVSPTSPTRFLSIGEALGPLRAGGGPRHGGGSALVSKAAQGLKHRGSPAPLTQSLRKVAVSRRPERRPVAEGLEGPEITEDVAPTSPREPRAPDEVPVAPAVGEARERRPRQDEGRVRGTVRPAPPPKDGGGAPGPAARVGRPRNAATVGAPVAHEEAGVERPQGYTGRDDGVAGGRTVPRRHAREEGRPLGHDPVATRVVAKDDVPVHGASVRRRPAPPPAPSLSLLPCPSKLRNVFEATSVRIVIPHR